MLHSVASAFIILCFIVSVGQFQLQSNAVALSKYKTLAQLMVQATEQQLWHVMRSQLLADKAKLELTIKVGSGRATYHKLIGRHLHQIVFGWKMVQSKFQPEQVRQWLTYKEIKKYGFYDGDTSLIHLLAHTCLHEFAHLLQALQGERHYRSVHNAAFYQILDQLHQQGFGESVKHYLLDKAADAGVALDFDAPLIAVTKTERNTAPLSVQLADWVEIRSDKVQGKVKIIKINRVTVDVVCQRGRGYRVHKSLLSV